MSGYVTVWEAARRLGVSYERARTLLHQRRLKGVRHGDRNLKVDEASLQQLLKERAPRAV
jgi:excisionase family DNA binding protein